MTNGFPLSGAIVEEVLRQNHIRDPGRASIRELSRVVDGLEEVSGMRFIRMEMGVPGLPVCRVGTEREVEILRSGATSQYPNIQGLPKFKKTASAFLKSFLDVEVEPRCCLPCTGSTNGSFLSFMVAGRRMADADTVLFLDPGFPVHKLQVRALGLQQRSLDVYHYRGARLRAPLEEILRKNKVSTILYSNPNNPTWICFTEEELEIIGDLCTAYNVVALEDLAYFGMDFRKDYSVPGAPPFPPTVARYTDNYILLVSSSKLFSYAGHRIGIVAVSGSLFDTRWQDLLRYFTSDCFGHALVFGAAYAVSAGVNYASQEGLAEILDATLTGRLPLLDAARRYGERARAMKRFFLDNGFRMVYDRDVDQPIADGFYFTVSYPGLSGSELVRRLLCFGVSAISLANTGSVMLDGIRACVSLVDEEEFPVLQSRLEQFHREQQEAGRGGRSVE